MFWADCPVDWMRWSNASSVGRKWLRLSKMDNSSWRRGSGQTESLEPTQGHQGHCSPNTFVRHNYANGNDSGHQLGANYDLTVSTTYYKLCNYNHTNENKSTYPWNKLDYGCLMLSCKLIDFPERDAYWHTHTNTYIHTHTHICTLLHPNHTTKFRNILESIGSAFILAVWCGRPSPICAGVSEGERVDSYPSDSATIVMQPFLKCTSSTLCRVCMVIVCRESFSSECFCVSLCQWAQIEEIDACCFSQCSIWY